MKMRMAHFVTGIMMLFQTGVADIPESYAASREQLGIPERKNAQVLDEGYLLKGRIYSIKYDTNGDGEPEMVEYYFSGHKNPFMLWYDRSGDGNPDPGEVYGSPGEDEDWMTGPPRKGLDL